MTRRPSNISRFTCRKKWYLKHERKPITQYTKENWLYNINIISDAADYSNIFSKFITEYLFFIHINMNINIISDVTDYTNIFLSLSQNINFLNIWALNHLMNINIIRNVADYTNIFSMFFTEYLFLKHTVKTFQYMCMIYKLIHTLFASLGINMTLTLKNENLANEYCLCIKHASYMSTHTLYILPRVCWDRKHKT